jgi:hypothetical protein
MQRLESARQARLALMHLLSAPLTSAGTTASVAIGGSVQDFDGTPISGADVLWGSYVYKPQAPLDGFYFPRMQCEYVHGGDTTSQADGTFSFSAVTPQTDGALSAVFSDTEGRSRLFSTWGNTFADGAADLNLRPGRIRVTSDRDTDGPWSGWRTARVELFSNNGGAARSWVTRGTHGLDGAAEGMPGQLAYWSVYYFDNEGSGADSWVFDRPIRAGQLSEGSLGMTQTTAQRLLVLKPYWLSGKPGVTVTVGLQQWQQYQSPARFYGFSEYPASAPVKVYSQTKIADSFDKTYAVNLAVPASATPGYAYQLHALSEGSMLDLRHYYQVCTLKSSATTVKAGRAVKLSGIIPTQGHVGSTRGQAKQVTVYRSTKAVSGPPTTWDAARKGWAKVATLRADGFGKYASGNVRVTKTTWFVVRYPGDKWYHDAYTSVVKVAVR